jgi:hypothetical protein
MPRYKRQHIGLVVGQTSNFRVKCSIRMCNSLRRFYFFKGVIWFGLGLVLRLGLRINIIIPELRIRILHYNFLPRIGCIVVNKKKVQCTFDIGRLSSKSFVSRAWKWFSLKVRCQTRHCNVKYAQFVELLFDIYTLYVVYLNFLWNSFWDHRVNSLKKKLHKKILSAWCFVNSLHDRHQAWYTGKTSQLPTPILVLDPHLFSHHKSDTIQMCIMHYLFDCPSLNSPLARSTFVPPPGGILQT